MKTPAQPASGAWYSHPWPWIFIGMLGATIIAGMVTLWIAIDSNDGLVADDYYKQGLGINKQLARGERAQAMALRAMLRIQQDGVLVALNARDVAQLPKRLKLVLAHPTRGGLDRTVVLEQEGSEWRGRTEPPPPGRWIVTLEDDAGTWRLDAAAVFPQDREIVLSAAPFKPVD